MADPVDASALAALEVQLRELNAVRARLEAARRDLVPPRSQFWRGATQRAYESALAAITSVVDETIGVVSRAAERSADATTRMGAGV